MSQTGFRNHNAPNESQRRWPGSFWVTRSANGETFLRVVDQLLADTADLPGIEIRHADAGINRRAGVQQLSRREVSGLSVPATAMSRILLDHLPSLEAARQVTFDRMLLDENGRPKPIGSQYFFIVASTRPDSQWVSRERQRTIDTVSKYARVRPFTRQPEMTVAYAPGGTPEAQLDRVVAAIQAVLPLTVELLAAETPQSPNLAR